MEVKIDFTKSAQDNANELYGRAKKLQEKKAGAADAVKRLEKKLEKARAKAKPVTAKAPKKIAKVEWYEKFHWFFTSTGMLAIGGRDAQQNELLNSRYFEDSDLFFHADVFGASVVILKDGLKADDAAKQEVAQFAACYSSAWKAMHTSVDVYAMRREQVSKSSESGYLGKGSFLLKGEREWFRNTRLELVMFVKEGKLNVAPQIATEHIKEEKRVTLKEGKDKKSDAAKKVSRALGFENIDAIIRQLPAGEFSVSAPD